MVQQAMVQEAMVPQDMALGENNRKTIDFSMDIMGYHGAFRWKLSLKSWLLLTKNTAFELL